MGTNPSWWTPIDEGTERGDMRHDTFENHAGSADNAVRTSLAGKARPILTFSPGLRHAVGSIDPADLIGNLTTTRHCGNIYIFS